MIVIRNIAAVCLGILVVVAVVHGGCQAVKTRQAEKAKAQAEAELSTTNLTTGSQTSQWRLTVTGKKREYSVSPKTNGLNFSVRRKE